MRNPDLVILAAVHLVLTEKRLTITLDMPPPQLVVEVLSLGKQKLGTRSSLQARSVCITRHSRVLVGESKHANDDGIALAEWSR
jgi:hypothetical protein